MNKHEKYLAFEPFVTKIVVNEIKYVQMGGTGAPQVKEEAK